jgi:predicted CopG family antitoxin
VIKHSYIMSTIKLKRIAVHETVYQQLKSLGSAGDSFNDVLVRILKNQPILNQKPETYRTKE